MSDDDSGGNTSYYLYTKEWFRLISSDVFYSDSYAYTNFVYFEGSIRSGCLVNNSGGVQFIELCYV